MSEIHILRPSDASGRVLGGIFGDISTNPNDPDVMKFKIDSGLKRCSLIFANLPEDGLIVSRDDVVTVEVPDSVADAIKASLARALQSNWDRQYESLMRRDEDDVQGGAALIGIPGMGSVQQGILTQILKTEQEVASQAVDALIENLQGVKPFFANVRVTDAWIELDSRGHELSVDTRGVGEASDKLRLTPIAAWGDFNHPMLDEVNMQEKAEEFGLGDSIRHCVADIDVALPIYLPALPDPGLFEEAQGGMDTIELQERQARVVIHTIMENPALRHAILNNMPRMVPDYDTASHIVLDMGEDDDEEDDDQDYEGEAEVSRVRER